MSADHISELMLGGAKLQSDIIDIGLFTPYFFGSCVAMLVAGILHDLIFNQSAYLLLLIINLVQIAAELILIFLHSSTYQLNPYFLSGYGFATEFSSFYLRCLIPLLIADRNRKGAFEMTMAGTIMATIQCAYFAT